MNIDNVLITLGVGRYQFTCYALFGLMIMYSNVSPVTYIFTASDLKYRCEIPECDVPNVAERAYEPDWLRFTMPYRDDSRSPRKCQRYVVNSHQVNHTRCVPMEFDENTTERCQDSWVFEDPENTIGTEFGFMCEENKWKLSMVGSVNNFGQLIGIPVSGIIADRFGRKFAMIFCASTSATISIVQSFSVSYPMFLGLELMSSIMSSGIYAVTFVLAIELMLSNKRVLYFSILECFYPVGAIFVTYIAHAVKDWRLLLRITNIPGLLYLSYFWLTDESIRWLEMKGKHDRMVDVLERIASFNKKTLPVLHSNSQLETTTNYDDSKNAKYSTVLKYIIHSPTILYRTIKSSVLWIAITLVYYGLTINATAIAGNKYLNFTLVSFVDIPACLLSWIIMKSMSRKMSLSCMFVLSGATCDAYNLMPDHFFWIKLAIFMVSKLAISIAFYIIYMLTAEIFPTSIRTTMLSLCSMFGRIGSMLAPQITLLNEYFGEYTAMLLMGITTLMAAIVTLTLPESKNVKLPDTIDEAEQIGNDLTLKIDERSL